MVMLMNLGNNLIVTLSLFMFQMVTAQKKNMRFDPDTYEPPICKIPPFQNSSDPNTYFAPTQGICGVNASGNVSAVLSNATLLAILAERYAPVIFFHPLEAYTLSNVDDTFANASSGELMHLDDNGFLTQIQDTISTSALFNVSRDPKTSPVGQEFFFRHYSSLKYSNSAGDHYNNDYRNGAGYDPDTGRSLAPIYYNAYDSGNGTLAFNYFMYYAWNGEANMAVLSSVNNQVRYTPFHLQPFGVHEGDWEALSVIICPPDTTSSSQEDQEPLAISYRQHGWAQSTDCTKGECNFYKDTVHPVGFAALNSHATYPVSTTNLIYTTVELPFYVNLQGFFVVDRTIYKHADGKSYNYFFPNSTNVRPMLDPDLLQASDTENAWQAFAGRWGNALAIENKAGPPRCLAPNQTAFTECPTDDPVFTFVMEFMGVYNSSGVGTVGAITKLTGSVGDMVSATHHGPTGPNTKAFFNKWLPPLTNFMYKTWPSDINETEFCNRINEIPDTSRVPVDLMSVNLSGQLKGMVGFLVFLAVVNILLLGYAGNRRATVALVEVDETTGEVQKPSWKRQLRVFVPGIIYTFAFGLSFIGVVMVLNNFHNAFELLGEFVKAVDWDRIWAALISIASMVIVLDATLLIFIWIPSKELWIRIHMEYFQRIDDKEMQEQYEAKIWWNTHVVNFITAVLSGLLFLSLTLSVLCIIIGTSWIGLGTAARNMCSSSFGAIEDNVCFDLSALGFKHITCGADFKTYCNYFSEGYDVRTLWGSMIFVVAQFYLIAAAGMGLYQQRSELASLEALNDLRHLRSALHLGEVGKQLDAVVANKDEKTPEAAIENS